MQTITICGGGSLGHVISGWLASHGYAKVNILTSKPQKWNDRISIDTPGGSVLTGSISCISNNPSEVIPASDVVLFCLPGFLIKDEILKVKPYLRPDAFIGSVFSSTGFFFEALNLLPNQPLWGFQRVPFIARVAEYGSSAHLLGYKSSLAIAVENVSDARKKAFASTIQEWFEVPVTLLGNYYEASLTNSNPLLHTSRLYTMFADGRKYDHMVLFYEEWTVEAAQLLIDMDAEFFKLLAVLPVSPSYLPPILQYYESTDAVSLRDKLSSIQGFKGITSPMVQEPDGSWGPDFKSRYFTEDFAFGLKYIHDLAHREGIPTPLVDKVFKWGCTVVRRSV